MKRQRAAGETVVLSRAGQNRESQRLRELAGAERHSGKQRGAVLWGGAGPEETGSVNKFIPESIQVWWSPGRS